MSEDSFEKLIQERRKRKLAELVAERHDRSGRGGLASLADAVDQSSSYLSQLLKPDGKGSRPITEKTARDFEDRLGLKRGWLDEAEGGGNAVAGSATVHGVGKVINPPPEIGQLISQLSQKGRRDVLESLSRELSAKDAAWAAVLFSSRAQELLERGDT